MNYDVIVSPLNTEKAMASNSAGQYVFVVRSWATKPVIAAAVESIFNVKVAKVNVLNTPVIKKTFKGISGTRGSFKKAFVKLSEGTINFEGGF